MHDDGLALVVHRLLAPLGLTAPSITAEADNAGYGAATFEVFGLSVRARTARVTPTKVGLFVAHWRRAPGGSTEPFDGVGSTDLVIVTTVEGDQAGAFLFPRGTLLAQGILAGAVPAGGVSAGRRGFRVYPPWSATTNAQAQRTQRWQGAFFVDLPPTGVNTGWARTLLERATPEAGT